MTTAVSTGRPPVRVRTLPRWRRVLPLAAIVGGLATALALLVVISAAAGLAAAGRLDRTAQLALVPAAVLGLACGGLVTRYAARLGVELQALHAEAVRRLRDPPAPARSSAGESLLVRRAGREVAELSRTFDALHLRLRVADDVAERHRRTADTAGAGVFELLSGLVAAEEAARGQLAAELHDTVAQSLMSARSGLSGVLEGTGGRAEPGLHQVADALEDAEEQVRAVMARTRPPGLRDGDLAVAVGGLRADFAARYGLVVEVSWPSSPYPLPLVCAVTVYRFFQEALLNVVKHADVDAATVGFEINEAQLVATVRDEGPGFAVDQVRSDGGRHVGLGLLRERARLAGGSLTVHSAAGAGTLLTLRLPRPVSARAQRLAG